MLQSPVLRRAGLITYLVAALCLLFTLITRAGTSTITLWFLFVPQQIGEGEIWRILTPVFLHFDWLGSPFLHLLFNVVIWLNFGGLIEAVEGRRRLLLLFLITAVCGNIAAYAAYGIGFGGLSGVVYGVIGYLWLRGRQIPAYHAALPTSMFAFFIAFLLLGYSGLLGNIANAAHCGGLLAGIALAAAQILFARNSRKNVI